uniref:F-box protein At3g26010-like beta-propeller domain-containing protein n=1 Tax=Oryza barthii TaxID=65489 RepID=A0A0D3HT91_9ORYZ
MAPRILEKALHSDIPDHKMQHSATASIQVVSKKYYGILTNNATFSARQARLCPPCPALIHMDLPDRHLGAYTRKVEAIDVLSSTPDIVGIPSGFDFLGCCQEDGIISLLASTNGLVCILYTPIYSISHSRAPILFIANPATQKAQPIPGTAKHITRFDKGIGLAFDPVDNFQENTVIKCKIVKAVGARTIEGNGTKFCFATFSSNTGCWAMSSMMVYVDTKINCNNKKVTYGNGIMYWDYQEIVLWFDIATDIAMPWIQLDVEVKGPVHHDIDTSADGMLVCTTIDKGGLIVYHLVGVNTDFNWEIKHERRWIDIMKDSIYAFKFCHSMQLRSGLQLERLTERRLVRPIGVVDGRFVYIGVSQEWKTKDKILCYNIVTSKTYDTGKELGNRYSKNPFYVYRNSMANIPHIVVPVQESLDPLILH